jgi:hypothetical protein
LLTFDNFKGGWLMRKSPLITLLLAAAVASANVWAGDLVTIDFEQGIEGFDLHSNGYPTRLETQGYTFYSSSGLSTENSSGGSIAWCPAPGCTISMYGGYEANLDKLKSLDIVSALIAPGTGTVKVVGVTWDFAGNDPILILEDVPFDPSWTTHVFDGQWETTQLQRLEIQILTNTGGPILLDNIVVDTGYIEVGIDVLPGDEANVVYPNKSGKLPIAILSSAEFDATQIYVPSLKINSMPTAELVGAQNVDGVHGSDLVVTFPVQQSGILCNDTEVTITGYSQSSTDQISGVGSIDASECEDGGCHAY